MKVLSVCLLAFFALAVSATFEGTWTDDFYGANFNYCCIRSTKLYCTYAELGIVDGTISGNTVSGKWYEGGGDVVSCSYGTFTWTLSQDGNSFSGSYQCHDSGSGSWDATRVSTEVPTAEQCGARTNSRDISGTTADGSFVLCNGGGEYQQSYFEDVNRPGYEEGITFDSGSIGTGYYYGHNLEIDEYNFGVSLQFVLENGAAVNLYRRGAVFGERPADFTLSTEINDFHGAVYDETWVVENPSSSDCLENKAIKKEVEDFFTATSGSSNSPSSGSPSTGSSGSSRSSGSSGSSGSSASGSSSDASTLAVGGVMVVLGAVAALF